MTDSPNKPHKYLDFRSIRCRDLRGKFVKCDDSEETFRKLELELHRLNEGS